jgi:mitochondrial chaperone BCS1
MISLSSQVLNDAKLDALFDVLPHKCIVLLEDIDSAGIRRETMRQPPKPELPTPPTVRLSRHQVDPFIPRQIEEPRGVTLSGLLNVLDGVRAAEGRIVIMTTNHAESLDEALIRRGRIDQKVHFGCASKQTALRLFTQIYHKSTEELLDGEALPDKALIDRLAEQFADGLAEDAFTPAEVQGYLIDHRADAEKAVKEAAGFFEQLSTIKSKGLNVPTIDENAANGAEDKEDLVNGTSDDTAPNGDTSGASRDAVPGASSSKEDKRLMPDGIGPVERTSSGLASLGLTGEGGVDGLHVALASNGEYIPTEV